MVVTDPEIVKVGNKGGLLDTEVQEDVTVWPSMLKKEARDYEWNESVSATTTTPVSKMLKQLLTAFSPPRKDVQYQNYSSAATWLFVVI